MQMKGRRGACAADGRLTDTVNHTSCGLSDGSQQEMLLRENGRDTTKIATAKAPRFRVQVVPEA